MGGWGVSVGLNVTLISVRRKSIKQTHLPYLFHYTLARNTHRSTEFRDEGIGGAGSKRGRTYRHWTGRT